MQFRNLTQGEYQESGEMAYIAASGITRHAKELIPQRFNGSGLIDMNQRPSESYPHLRTLGRMRLPVIARRR